MNRDATAADALALEIADRGASPPRQPSIEARRRLVAESLSVGNPSNKGKELPDIADPPVDCQMELPVDSIKPYDRNPRRGANVKFSDIKESIRACGIRNPLTVTRRAGERHFIVEAGGNTRLIAIQQLWAETKEARFQKITVLFRPWRSESHVLTAHLIENDQRGELSFWDKACGVMALKAQLESETGRALSLRDFEEELKRLGMSGNRSTLSQSQFATEKLGALGPAVVALSGLDVKTIQPRLNLLKRYAAQRARTEEADLYGEVLDKVLRRYGAQYVKTQAFDAGALCEACEQALADHLAEPVSELRRVLCSLDNSESSVSNIQPNRAALTTAEHHFPVESNSPEASSDAAELENANTRLEPEAIDRPATPQVPEAVPKAVEGRLRGESKRGVAHDTGQNAALLEDLRQCVAHFARITHTADCLHFHESMPGGFYMEMPEPPLGEEIDPESRIRAWWLLTLISGQLHDYLSARLPAESRWRRMHGDAVNEGGLTVHVGKEMGGLLVLNLELADWLLDSGDDAAALFLEIAVLVKKIREVAPAKKPSAHPQQAIEEK